MQTTQYPVNIQSLAVRAVGGMFNGTMGLRYQTTLPCKMIRIPIPVLAMTRKTGVPLEFRLATLSPGRSAPEKFRELNLPSTQKGTLGE